MNRSDWPEYERRRYEWSTAVGDFWKALSEQALFRRIGSLRLGLQRRAMFAYADAVQAERDALGLLREVGRL